MWDATFHFAYQESKESIYRYAAKIKNVFDQKTLFDEYAKNEAFVLNLERDVMIVICHHDKDRFIDGATVAHECFHAISFVLRNLGVRLSEESEEVYAYGLEWLCREAFYFCFEIANKLNEENIMAAKKSKNHPGFKSVQGKIEKEGYSKKEAGAILAKSTRNASASAKKANPRLKKVGGKKK
jgi:hypothetical protein